MARLKTLQSRLHTQPARINTMQPDSWRADKTSTERGYGYKWQIARERYLKDHPLCVMCKAEGRVEIATIVDHIVPHRGDMQLFWDSRNWQALCATHHNRDKQRQEHHAS